jgi:hypothetical protein
MLAVAIAGTEGVADLFSRDPKACLIILVAMDAAGSKTHAWIIARKQVTGSEACFRVRQETEIAETRVFVRCETSGWRTQEIGFDCLEWLAEVYRVRWFCHGISLLPIPIRQ